LLSGAEQSLESGETCCLSELYLPNIKSKEELFKCAKYLYRVCKHSLTLPCPDSKFTEEVVHRNMRMGIGVTGYLQCTEEQKSWLSPCYEYLRDFDKKYSMEKGFPTSIKICTVKPSGCSRRDMLIQTSKGLLRLDEIGDVDGEEWQDIDDLYAITDDNTKEKITKFYINGKVPTKQIITRDGLELESSLNHKYRIINDQDEYIWKTTEELEVGDRLVVKLGDCENKREVKFQNIEYKNMTNSIEITQPTKMTKDIAWFLGMFYADGSVHTKGIRISFNRKHPSIVKWLFKFFVDTFGIEPTMGDDRLASSSGGAVYVSNQMLLRWLKKNNCCKSYSGSLEIPEIIRRSSKECMLGFVDGFWRADGGVHKSCWSICTISKIFAQQFLVMCRSLGFNVVLNNAGPGGLGAQDRYVIRNRSCDKSKLRYQPKEFRSRMWKDYWLDPIEVILDSSCNTYDIEVENVHHYKMGGVVSHNTLSLLGGCTSGVHPGFSQYYIRRVRISADSPLIKLAQKHGYHVEFQKNFDQSIDPTTQIISFPYSLPAHTKFAADCSAVEQLEYVKRMQTEWSDNSVSCTVYYRKEELKEIKEWLSKNYNNSIKSVSFLLHSDHGFQQAPMEAIDKKTYDEMVKNSTLITSVEGVCYSQKDEKFVGDGECKSGGHCPIR
jgi:intein/homing endonuclease